VCYIGANCARSRCDVHATGLHRPQEMPRARVSAYNAFRGPQQEIVEHGIGWRIGPGAVPSGGGKSLSYQVARPLSLPGLAVVHLTLIALMQDQGTKPAPGGVRAAGRLCIASLNAEEKFSGVASPAESKRVDLLYVSPERLAAGDLLDRLRPNTAGPVPQST